MQYIDYICNFYFIFFFLTFNGVTLLPQAHMCALDVHTCSLTHDTFVFCTCLVSFLLLLLFLLLHVYSHHGWRQLIADYDQCTCNSFYATSNLQPATLQWNAVHSCPSCPFSCLFYYLLAFAYSNSFTHTYHLRYICMLAYVCVCLCACVQKFSCRLQRCQHCLVAH